MSVFLTEVPARNNGASAIERAIATKLIDDILAARYTLGVNDGEELVLEKSTDKAAILKAMFSTYEDVLIIRHPEGSYAGKVWLIYGNGTDVISDNTATEEINDLLKGAEAMAEQLANTPR